jgi:ABC-2 type transport system permease protein
MRNVFAIAKREVKSYLVSPIAYLVTAAFLLLCGLYFGITLLLMAEYGDAPTVRPTIDFAVIIFVFAAPLLTMRLLAQERRMGTLELILTSPVKEWELVLGKFCAGLAFYLIMIVPTLLYPLVLELFGNPDWGPVLSGYMGLVLFGAVLLSVGVLASALTQSQIVAAVLGIAGNFFLYFFLGWFVYIPGTGSRAGNVLRLLDLQGHLQTFLSGALDTRDIVYCLSLTAFFLFLTTRVLEARRWRA